MTIKFEKIVPKNNQIFLLPNINRSDRELPDQVDINIVSQNILIDTERSVRKLSDKEIYSLKVIDDNNEINAGKRFFLEITCNNKLYMVLNKSGLPYKYENTKFVLDINDEYRTNTKGNEIQLYVEAQTFLGSPLLDTTASLSILFEFKDENQSTLKQFKAIDGSIILPPELILIGDDAPAEQVLICELEENKPSVMDVSDVVSGIGVSLIIVPQEAGWGDTWLQDQFQIAAAREADGKNKMLVVIHLPRMMNVASLQPTTPNLKNFTDYYFPSRGIGIFKDFWKTDVSFSDANGKKGSISVAASYVVYKSINSLIFLLKYILNKIRLQTGKVILINYSDLFTVRSELNRLILEYAGLYPGEIDELARINNSVKKTDQFLKLQDRGVVLMLVLKKSAEAESYYYDFNNKQLLQNFYEEIEQIHGSFNYGGNIEVSPPFGSAVSGKILTGTLKYNKLLNFLTSSGSLQPHVMAGTSFLEVGHIDEIMSFVKDSSAAAGFSILRASPILCISMLESLSKIRTSGTLVTRLFRGKKWIHETMPGLLDAQLPPATFKFMIDEKMYDLDGLNKKYTLVYDYYDSVYTDDRKYLVYNKLNKVKSKYASFITVDDILNINRKTNQEAEDLFLSNNYKYADDLQYKDYYNNTWYKEDFLNKRLDTVLNNEFEGVPVYPVPVLFDRVESFLYGGTKAVVPDLVNLQTLGKHLLVPKPYGPRMRPEEAIDFIKDLLKKEKNERLESFASNNLDKKYIGSRSLDMTTHWTKAGEWVNMASAEQFSSDFDSDYGDQVSYPEFGIPSTNYNQLLRQTANHPIRKTEDLMDIANYFKDGFDEFKNIEVNFCDGEDADNHPQKDFFDKTIVAIMDKIAKANPKVFDKQGKILSKGWTKIAIPENTVDVFELYTHLLLESMGMEVHWVDSWYYHTHSGGIHCGTNVLRSIL